MMPTWIKEVQAIGQAFGTPLVALAAVSIAYQQYRLSRQKLKADLYPRRFAVYRSVLMALVNCLNEDMSISLGSELHERMIEARFLFDKPTFDYLSEVETKIYQNGYLNTVKDKTAESIRLANNDKSWLLGQIRVISERVHPFLNVDDKLSFSLVVSDNIKMLRKIV